MGSVAIPDGLAQRLGRTERHRLHGDEEIVDLSKYPGGYVMTYEPQADRAENLSLPHLYLPIWVDYREEIGLSIMDIVADEQCDLIYVVMDYWAGRKMRLTGWSGTWKQGRTDESIRG